MKLLFTEFLETPAVISGLLNIYLAARANIWNWLFGVITVGLYIIIFLNVKLYADMSLYFLFLGLQFYGWYAWTYGGNNRSHLAITHASHKIYITALLATIIFFFSIAYMLQTFTDSTTVYMDAFTTALSLVAQWMMTKKWLENWWLWMLVDLIAIKMYLVKHLYLTAGLYGVFFVLCIFGYMTWKNSLVQPSTSY